MVADVIHPEPQVLLNCMTCFGNGSQQLVDGVSIGDQFIREDLGTIHTCAKIHWMENRYFYGYEDPDLWLDKKYSWVPARHVKPFTLLDVFFD